jgi:hypothetical protein
MTGRISLILGKPSGHRRRLQIYYLDRLLCQEGGGAHLIYSHPETAPKSDFDITFP